MPSLEAKRLEALYPLEILDTPREERFDRVTRTAVRLFRMPKSLPVFVDETRAWVKSGQGVQRAKPHRPARGHLDRLRCRDTGTGGAVAVHGPGI